MLSKIIFFLARIKGETGYLYYFNRYFFLPNFYKIFSKRLRYNKISSVQQLLICEGKGIVYIGDSCSFGYKLGGFNRKGSIELQARYKDSKIIIGNKIATNNNVYLCAANHIEIGNDTLIGQNVTIMDHEAHGVEPYKRGELGEIGKVIIGKNVWIGNNVVILKNTVIGDNTIVATGAIVSGAFPENVIIGGVPAKIIKPI
jgi:acetyltransferase-like isoleucine patch superfamily enzyme